MRRTLYAFLLIALAACTAPPTLPPFTSVPADWQLTQTALTEQAVSTVASPEGSTPSVLISASPLPASLTPAGTPTSRPSTTPTRNLPAAVTATPTLAPQIPAAAVEITAPGALSRALSPIPVRAMLVPGDQGRVTVELIGEDSRVIARQIVILNPDLGRKAGLVIDLPFEIPSEAELARLAIYRQDEFGRTTALSSVDLILLSTGQPDYNVVVDRLAQAIIQEPLPDAIIQGGVAVISGLARPTANQDYVAELIAETGQIVGQRVFDVPDFDPGQHLPFIVEVPFTVDEATWVLLIIRARGDRIPGITYLVSTEVLLSP